MTHSCSYSGSNGVNRLSKKMRVLFFINTLYTGGAEKVLVDVANQLSQNNYEVTIISVMGGPLAAGLSNRVKSKTLIQSENRLVKYILERIYFKLLPYRLFGKLFLKGDFDVRIAYVQGFPTNVLAKLNDTRAAKIAFIHSDFSKRGDIYKYYRTKEECLSEYQSFDKVCFVANAAKDGFFKTIGELDNAMVIHNVIDVDAVRKLSLQPVDDEYHTTGLKIITVGRLSSVKAFDRLIRISSFLKTTGIEHEIWIVGEGEQRKQLEDLIIQKGVNDTVKLLGYKSNPYQYVVKSDLYVCSSLFEGYSTSVAEALALGVPVLTTQCSGMDEILHNGEFGTIVSNDEDSLRNELHRIAHDQSVLEQYRNRAFSGKACYSPENSLREYDALFKDL